MEAYNDIVSIMKAQGHHEILDVWENVQDEKTEGKSSLEYEIIALEFFADQLEMHASLHQGLSSSLADLGLSGIQFGDGPAQSLDEFSDDTERYTELAKELRHLVTLLNQGL